MLITQCALLHCIKTSKLRTYFLETASLTPHSSVLRGWYGVPTFQTVAEESQRHAAVRKGSRY